MRTLDKLNRYSGIIAIILSLFVFAFGTLNDCTGKEEKAKERYEDLAGKYRPSFSLVEGPKITELTLTLDTTWFKKYSGLTAEREDTTMTVPLGLTSVNIKIGFTILNSGNSPGRLTINLLADSLTNYSFLYKRFIDYIDFNKVGKNIEDISKPFTLLPGQKKDIDKFEYFIRFPSDSSFKLHLNLVYSNEHGTYFSTYYTFDYKFNLLGFNISDETINKAKKYSYHRILMQGDVVSLTNFTFDTDYYSYEFAEEIKTKFETLKSETKNLINETNKLK